MLPDRPAYRCALRFLPLVADAFELGQAATACTGVAPLVGAFADMTHHRLHDGQLAHHIDERCDSAQCQQRTDTVVFTHSIATTFIFNGFILSSDLGVFFSTAAVDASSRCSCAFMTAAHSQVRQVQAKTHP